MRRLPPVTKAFFPLSKYGFGHGELLELNDLGMFVYRRGGHDALLAFGQLAVLVEVVKLLGPRRVPGTVLVEQRAALVLGAPRHGAVDEGLGKEQRIPGFSCRLDHVMRIALKVPDVLGQVARVVGLVAARHAGEAAIALIGIGEKKGHHAQAIAHLAVAVAEPVVGILAGTAVETATGVAAIHDDGVVVVDADLGGR